MEQRVIVMKGSNFPTDNYVAQGLVGQLGDGYRIRFAEAAELGSTIDGDVAAITAQWRSGTCATPPARCRLTSTPATPTSLWAALIFPH